MVNREKFLEYFDEKKIKDKNCLKNYRNRRVIFSEKIDGEMYYIKKYIPHKQRERAIAFGLQRDRAEHYKFISEKLDKLGIPHIRPEFVIINRKTFFKRESLVITKYGGISLGKIPDFDKIQKRKLIDKFFDYFIVMCKNGIYPTDYNFGGALVRNEELYLIDFDPYRTKMIVTKKFREYVIYKLERRACIETNFGEEFNNYLKNQIYRVRRELGW
ncbi:hypothetical protein [uncultured Ilyobacter sp.]|uniref:hypothetical protein n=1 Tax=uncultured Ilyobacter sp. TaxID=544433 RepID=UPI0029C7DA59|nr:hypothetical protein [uncultured Ilyobacter sp.]